jgi:prophage antirepressor-like protein
MENSTLPQIFEFNNHEVRMITIDGKPWFVAKDITDILGYSDGSDAVRKHCKSANTLAIRQGIGNPNQTIINEGDVYRLIIKSRLPAADQFEEWVMNDVLPSIRQTGGYFGNMSKLEIATAYLEAVKAEIAAEKARVAAEKAKIALESKISSNVLFPRTEPQDNGADHIALTSIQTEIAPYLSVERIKDVLRYYGHGKTIVRLPSSGMKIKSFERSQIEDVFERFKEEATCRPSASRKTLLIAHDAFGNEEANVPKDKAIEHLGCTEDYFSSDEESI